MQLIILITGLIALSLAIFSHFFYLIVPLAVIFFAYVVLLAYDLMVVKESLLNLVQVSANSVKKAKTVKNYPTITSQSNQIIDLFYQLKIKHGQQNLQSVPPTSLTENSLITHTKESLFDWLLEKFVRVLNCEVGVLIYRGNEGQIVCSSRKNIEPGLKDILTDVFNDEYLSLLNSTDNLSSNYILNIPSVNFSRFGFKHGFFYGLNRFNMGISEPLLCWFAFNSYYSEIDFQAAVTYEMQKMKPEFLTSWNINELSTRVQAVERQDHEKTEFLTHMSHDIRSPLNNVKAILQVCKQNGSDNKLTESQVGEFLDVALNNCEALGEIVEDIIDFSRYSAGKLQARKEVFDLVEVVQKIVASYQVTAEMKNLKLSLRVPETQVKVFVDRKHLRRIVGNLLSNAIKYTMRGSVTLTVKSDTDLTWELSIQDTGLGMSAEQLKRLFQPFTRFHSELAEGVGLGLTVSKILVEQNAGTLIAHSTKGAGTEFVLTLPAAVQVERVPNSALNLDDNLEFVDRKLRVLVVDDDADCVESLARELSRSGYDVHQATNVRDAISIINYEQPEIVVSDVSMPGGGGVSILEALQAMNSRTSSQSTKLLPGSRNSSLAIMLTGYDSDSDREALLRKGAHAVLQKPVEIEVLQDVISKVLV